MAALVAAVGLTAFYANRILREPVTTRAVGVPGSAQAGRQAIERYACYTCHSIPGVPRADATVGPPLAGIAQRSYVAGVLSNTPHNLRLWIMEPQRYSPGSAMPDMGVTERDATDIVAYLYGLGR